MAFVAVFVRFIVLFLDCLVILFFLCGGVCTLCVVGLCDTASVLMFWVVRFVDLLLVDFWVLF